MEIKLIKFGTVSAIDKFIAQHEVDLHRLKNTPSNPFNREKLNAIPQMEEDLTYLRKHRAEMLKTATANHVPKFKLYDRSLNNAGHCQITYHSWNEYGELLTYCLQDNGKKFGGVRLMRCSRDGEPSHEVRLTVPAYFEVPQTKTNYYSDYTEELIKLCQDWIKKNALPLKT